MPYYEYECIECGQQFEAQQSFDEHERHEDHERHRTLKCPKCDSKKLRQLVSASVHVITSKKS